MTARSDHAGAFEKQVRQLCEGLSRELPTVDGEVLFAGRPTTHAQVRAQLQAMVDAFDAVHRADRALRQAIADRRRAMPGFRSTYGDAVVFLNHLLGKDNPRLALFGVRRAKAREPLTANARAIAKAKAAATRRARGTLGPVQRLAIRREPQPSVVVLGPDGRPMGASAEGASSTGAVDPGQDEPSPEEEQASTGQVGQLAPSVAPPQST